MNIRNDLRLVLRLVVAISLSTAALTTIAIAWMAWFGFRTLWISGMVALGRLWALRDRIDYDKALYETPSLDTINSYRDELSRIFKELNDSWLRVRQGQ